MEILEANWHWNVLSESIFNMEWTYLIVQNTQALACMAYLYFHFYLTLLDGQCEMGQET